MKRLLPLFLALLMICLSLAACNKNKEATTTPGDEVTLPPADTEIPYELQLKDLAEREMTILMPEGQIKQFTEDTANPDVLNQGIAKRNEFVETALNCTLDFNNIPLNAELMSSVMTAEMLNQTGDYDIVFYEYWWNQEIHGYFYNLLESEVIAIDQPFYNNGWNDAATIMGTLNSLTGYGSIHMMQRTAVTAFTSTAPGTSRLASVSSTRRNRTPPLWWAIRSAVRPITRLPRCTKPVGEGAIRVTTAPSGRFLVGYFSSSISGVSVTLGNRSAASA